MTDHRQHSDRKGAHVRPGQGRPAQGLKPCGHSGVNARDACNNDERDAQAKRDAPRRAAGGAPFVVPMRVQKFLARSGVASRRGSENLMTAGRVRVNGVVVTELGSKVDPGRDVVTVDGKPVHLEDGNVYIMLYKPEGYITTMDDPYGRPSVRQLIPVKDYPALFPVGRLDMDTTGLLLFTTDGELAHRVLHPSRHVDKRYVALVRGRITEKQLNILRKGVILQDGPCAPAQVRTLKPGDPLAAVVEYPTVEDPRTSVVEVTIHEGRNRQVKRMLDAVGHPVIHLHRQNFGPLDLTGVDLKAWRHLTDSEVAALKQAVE